MASLNHFICYNYELKCALKFRYILATNTVSLKTVFTYDGFYTFK